MCPPQIDVAWKILNDNSHLFIYLLGASLSDVEWDYWYTDVVCGRLADRYQRQLSEQWLNGAS